MDTDQPQLQSASCLRGLYHDGHNHDGHNHDGHNHDGHNHDGHNHDGHNHDGHKLRHDGYSNENIKI